MPELATAVAPGAAVHKEIVDILFEEFEQYLVHGGYLTAPKKPKKIVFADPFIFHAVRHWLNPTTAPPRDHIQAAVNDPIWAGRLAEACVATHLRRYFPTYYIKAEGEVDVAVIREGRFWPIEVKWTGQLRPKDLKQISKYPNGIIWARVRLPHNLQGVPVEPLPLALVRLGASGQ